MPKHHAQRDGDRNMVEVDNQHLDTDKHQNHRQTIFEHRETLSPHLPAGNIARRPRIANRFEVSTINGSVVTAKIAGILSTAKITSLNSTRISTSISGVAYNKPFCHKEMLVVDGWSCANDRVASAPAACRQCLIHLHGRAPFTPVNSRKAPKIYKIQSNCEISQLPVKIGDGTQNNRPEYAIHQHAAL